MKNSILVLTDPSADLSKYSAASGATNIGVQVAIAASDFNHVVIAGNTTTTVNFDNKDIKLLNYHTYGNSRAMAKSFEVVRTYLRNNPGTSVHSHLSTPSAVGYLVKLLEEFPELKVVHTFHTWWNSMMITYSYKTEHTLFFNHPRSTSVFVAESQRDGYQGIYKDLGDSRVILNGSYFQTLLPSVPKNYSSVLDQYLPDSWKSSEFNYHVCVSRLVQSKNPLMICQAILNTPSEKLILIGSHWIKDKEYGDQVLKLIEDNPDRLLNLHGLTTYEVMCVVYAAKLFTIVSSHDCCSLAMIEAALVNTPLLGWDNSGVTESVKVISEFDNEGCFNNAELFSFKYRSKYAKKIDTLSELMMKYTTKVPTELKQITPKYQWDRLVVEYLDLYKEVYDVTQ